MYYLTSTFCARVSSRRCLVSMVRLISLLPTHITATCCPMHQHPATVSTVMYHQRQSEIATLLEKVSLGLADMAGFPVSVRHDFC